LLLELCNILPNSDQHVAEFPELGFVGRLCPGMMIVSFVVAARLASDAAIIPSMLPPVE